MSAGNGTVIVVTGTGTEVGKTFVTAALVRALRARGIVTHARKPVQSFAPGDVDTDADVLARASGEPSERVCPRHRWLATPMAPPMAADALGLPAFRIGDLVAEIDAPASGVTLVEGAGGLLSPLASDGDTRALVDACRPDVVILVADAGLGTINLTRLSAEALGNDHRLVVFLNRFDERDDLHRRNLAWLCAHEGFDALTDVEALCTRVEALTN